MDCKNWKVQNRNITEEEALKFVYPKDIRQIKKPHVLYDRDYICEDKANTLSCVYEVEIHGGTFYPLFSCYVPMGGYGKIDR